MIERETLHATSLQFAHSQIYCASLEPFRTPYGGVVSGSTNHFVSSGRLAAWLRLHYGSSNHPLIVV